MVHTKNALQPGTLYVVATPIGNLGDISQRARDVLADVDIIAAEDTRTTGRLLSLLDVKTDARFISYHDHNAPARASELSERLSEGSTVAVVSDAGTPCLSDPGMRLVRAAAEARHPVVAVPGASAFLAALVTSGLPTDAVTFHGFLPARQGKRRSALEAMAAAAPTAVFYESPGRVVALLQDIHAVLGARRCSVHREITKMHEETLRGTVGDVAEALTARPSIRGEFTVVVEGSKEKGTDEAEARRLTALLAQEALAPAAIKRVVSSFTGVRKKQVHAWLMEADD